MRTALNPAASRTHTFHRQVRLSELAARQDWMLLLTIRASAAFQCDEMHVSAEQQSPVVEWPRFR